jgi:hypothetical protein
VRPVSGSVVGRPKKKMKQKKEKMAICCVFVFVLREKGEEV